MHFRWINASLLALIVLSLAGFSLAEDSETPPIMIGTPCDEFAPAYIWTTSERSSWVIDDLYAVPIAFDSVEIWPDKAVFHESLIGALQSPNNPANFALACTSIWNDFIEGYARIFVRFGRNISSTSRTVRCENQFWAITDEIYRNVPDVSDFILAGEPDGYDTGALTSEALTVILQETLDSLNAQPGAEIVPFDAWFEQQSTD